MKGLLQFFETDLEDCCSLHINSEHIWHRGVMVVADQASLNITFHFIVLSELLRMSYCHYTALYIACVYYNVQYNAMYNTVWCKSMQSYVLHSALQCLACKLHYGIEYNEGFTCATTLQELWIISSCRRYVFQCLFCCSQQCVEDSTVRAWSPDPKAESLPSRKVGWWNPVSASQREQVELVQPMFGICTVSSIPFITVIICSVLGGLR